MRNQPAHQNATVDDYLQRVNAAIDYIVGNLDQSLDLDTLAGVAYFSPFHFHRVFKSVTGETLNAFVKRLRLERALQTLAHGREKSLTAIALSCGFQSVSDFSRSFKKRYGVPPSQFDLDAWRRDRRNELEAIVDDASRTARVYALSPGENPDGFTVTLRDHSPRQVAYLRVLNPYRPDVVPAGAERLMTWAKEHDFDDGQWLGYMWDDPTIVALPDCRYDVGVVVDDSCAFEPAGEVGRIDFPAMRVAMLEMRGPIELEMRALTWLYDTWLPQSGYMPADQPAFEAWIGKPFEHGMEHFELRIELPVTRL